MRLDLAELLVYLLKETSSFTFILYDIFKNNEGYETLVNNLVDMSVSGLKEQQVLK